MLEVDRFELHGRLRQAIDRDELDEAAVFGFRRSSRKLSKRVRNKLTRYVRWLEQIVAALNA